VMDDGLGHPEHDLLGNRGRAWSKKPLFHGWCLVTTGVSGLRKVLGNDREDFRFPQACD
jgi:hypothetical protein